MKPHIKTLPCFPQVAAVIGESRAQIELFKAVGWFYYKVDCNIKNKELAHSFVFMATIQGWEFWHKIDLGINPYHD